MAVSLFLTILKMNGIAAVTALLILLAKFVLQKAGMPRRILFLLWAVIGFRLLCPFSLSTEVSLFNAASFFERKAVTADAARYSVTPEVQMTARPAQNTAEGFVPADQTSDQLTKTLSLVWLGGLGTMLVLGAVSYISLKRRLRFAMKYQDGVYIAADISSSFVLGLVRPKIYIPDGAEESDTTYMLLHERAHMKRADHIVKLLAFLLLAVHWFNPLNWVLFKLFSDDMELACDESVLTQIGLDKKKEYASALLRSAVGLKSSIFLYNVCFSVHITKRRIQNMLRYKPPSKTLTVTAMAFCLLLAVFCGTNAMADRPETNTHTVLQENPGPDKVMPEAPSEDDAAIEVQKSGGTDADKNPKNASGTLQDIPQHTATFQAKQSAVDEFLREDAEEETQAPSPVAESTGNAEVLNTKINSTAGTEAELDPAAVSVDFEQVRLDDAACLSGMQQTLDGQGFKESSGVNADLEKNYIIQDYSFKNGCTGGSSGIICGDDGRISLYFDINTDSLVDITFMDSQTKEVVGSFVILTNRQTSHSFFGFDKHRTYDVVVRGRTGSDWKVEGQYIVY